MTDTERIIERFHQVKSLGFVKSERRHNTGIGQTFEHYVGVVENNLDEPDLFGFEIKSHREAANSPISLVTKSPNLPFRNGNNKYLLDKFGQADCRFAANDLFGNNDYGNNPKKLFASLFADRYSIVYDKYRVRLRNERNNRVLKIEFSDLNGDLIDDSVGYTYDLLERTYSNKLKHLFYVTAETRTQNGIEYFYYSSAEIYTQTSFDNFLNLLDSGKIQYDIRMGSYESGPKRGKFHDHGSCLRINEMYLHELYAGGQIVS